MKPILLPSRTEPCKHESYVMDKQIRVIECTQCGIRAWVEKDQVDLFAPDLTTSKKHKLMTQERKIGNSDDSQTKKINNNENLPTL